jgi:hypothetical protein
LESIRETHQVVAGRCVCVDWKPFLSEKTEERQGRGGEMIVGENHESVKRNFLRFGVDSLDN